MRDRDKTARIVRKEGFKPRERVGVEVVGGLVEQKQIGLAAKSARERKACALTSRKRLDGERHLLLGKSHALEDRVAARAEGKSSVAGVSVVQIGEFLGDRCVFRHH